MTALFLIGIIFLEPLALMIGWNGIVTKTFNINEINYIQSFGLNMLASLIFAQKLDYFTSSSKLMKLSLQALTINSKSEPLDDEETIHTLDDHYYTIKFQFVCGYLIFFWLFSYLL